MQATVVLLLALGGLGCQNPVSELPPVLPDVRQSAPQPSNEVSSAGPAPSGYTPPVAYPVSTQDLSGCADAADEDSFGRCARNTFCSFFLGRDPGVPTARQIEAAYHAGLYDR